jgi:hypothetical protein
MSGQVIFLPGWRQVSDEEMVIRLMRQDELRLAHVEFYQTFRHLPAHEYIEKKEMVYRRARQAIGIVMKLENTQ